jgi:hypothetical protein
MSDNVVSVLSGGGPSGLTPYQFRKIDQVFCVAASKKVLCYRSVGCDFDEGVMTISFAQSEHHSLAISFVARKVGPKVTMYELYIEGKGRAEKSALFDRVFESFRQYVADLMEEKH